MPRSLYLGKCKYDSRRKPPFLKGRFGGNVNVINCGSADSLSLNTRVRIYDDCVEVGGKGDKGGEGDKGGKAVRRVVACCVARRTTKKPNPYRIRLEEAATYSPT